VIAKRRHSTGDMRAQDEVEFDGLRPALTAPQRARRALVAVGAVALATCIAVVTTGVPAPQMALAAALRFMSPAAGAPGLDTPLTTSATPGCMPSVAHWSRRGRWVEVQGTTSGRDEGEFWLLLPRTAFPIPVAEGVYLTFRMTGTGVFHVMGDNAEQRRILTMDDPVAHATLDWGRPGNEWRVLARFPTSGCWHVHARRYDLVGDMWVLVAGTGVTAAIAPLTCTRVGRRGWATRSGRAHQRLRNPLRRLRRAGLANAARDREYRRLAVTRPDGPGCEDVAGVSLAGERVSSHSREGLHASSRPAIEMCVQRRRRSSPSRRISCVTCSVSGSSRPSRSWWWS
jgi:hypothetical protein